jgi:hypothetical protein
MNSISVALSIHSLSCFLLVLIYTLSLIAIMSPQTRIVTISNITPSLFNQLQLEHGETLSCPCSNTIVPYNIFVSNTVKFHPICSSIFVGIEWITALYDSMASAYLIMDFRTTARAQVSKIFVFVFGGMNGKIMFVHTHTLIFDINHLCGCFIFYLVPTSSRLLFAFSRRNISDLSQS